MSADRRDAAFDYASRRWLVLPLWWPLGPDRCACPKPDCSSPGKHPHGNLAPNGLLDATFDPEMVADWWAKIPELNVGLRTGVTFDVLDLDRPEAGRWLADRAAQLGEDTETCWAHGPMTITGHGHHLLYAPTGARNSSKVGGVAGFDWRGVNGYMVAPPSRHHEGHEYAWHEDCGPDTPIPTAPTFLAALARKEQPVAPAPSRFADPAAFTTGGRGTWSAAGLVGTMAVQLEGGRNDTLVWAAHRIGLDVHGGKATRAEGDAACEQLHRVAVGTGLGDTEVETTITSGYGAGLAGRTRKSERPA